MGLYFRIIIEWTLGFIIYLLLMEQKAILGCQYLIFIIEQNVWYYEYDFNQEPVLKTRVKYLGFVPNINLKFEF